MPETKLHLDLRTALYLILSAELGERACIGSEQFVYWNARDPRRCVAPDALVKLGAENVRFASWKTWERGTPELAVEIVSESDDDPQSLEDKLLRYHELGVRELVRFDPRATEGARLRVWDRIDDDLVERALDRRAGAESAESTILDGYTWIVAPLGEAEIEAALRLARGAELVPTPGERAEQEAARAAREEQRAKLEAERARAAAANAERERAAREEAERRIAELEAELAKRRG